MALASRGLRDMDGGPEGITDRAELDAVRRQARGIHVRAAVIAVVVALVAVALG